MGSSLNFTVFLINHTACISINLYLLTNVALTEGLLWCETVNCSGPFDSTLAFINGTQYEPKVFFCLSVSVPRAKSTVYFTRIFHRPSIDKMLSLPLSLSIPLFLLAVAALI